MAGTSIDVLQIYGFEIELADRDLIQTGWRFSSDGYRDRATVAIRPRATDLYNGSIRIVVETQGEGGSWRTTEPTTRLREQYKDMRLEVRLRLQTFMTQN